MAPNGRPLIFGETLFDHFPDGTRVMGGAPFNVAWHLQAFGAKPLLVSRIGNDPEGDELTTRMQGWGMDVSGVQRDPDHATGAVTVSLSDQGQPSYDLHDDRAYDHIETVPQNLGSDIALLYHGSLALRHKKVRATLEALCQHTGAPTFVDINLRDPWWTKDTVFDSIRRARWLKVNDEELLHLSEQNSDIKAIARSFLKTYDLHMLVVTQGANGAFAVTHDGQIETVTPHHSVSVVDTVGAGDAFASVLVLGVLQGWPLSQTLNRAQSFASTLVGQRGATVDDLAFYTSHIQV